MELHDTVIKLSGIFFAGSLREKPLDNIQAIDAISTVGTYGFRIVFDPTISRGKFWLGIDDILILSPGLFENTTEFMHAVISANPEVRVEPSAQELLYGKRRGSEHISFLLFGSFSVIVLLASIFMLINKF